MQNNRPRENKMGVMPVGRLIVTMALPMIVSMLIQALYNVVDSMFVSRIHEDALAAVSLAFPVQNLLIGLCTGTGVGVNALLSRSLGQKNYNEANRAAHNGIFLAVLGAIAFFLFGLFGARAFFATQTDNADIVAYGADYLSLVTMLSFGVFGEIILERLLQSTGKTFYTMITQGTGAILNIIFDPIFIFGYFGFPAMGVRGAALATVLGQIVALILGLVFNLKFNREISLNMVGFKPSWRVIRTIYAVGLPSIVMMLVGSVMNYGINQILLGFTSTATAVFGVYFKLQSFVFMPVFGLNNGMVPIVAYNYGARNKERILKTIRISIGIATGVMLLGLAIFQLLPAQLLGLFNPTPELLAIGVPALRLISLSFIFAGFCVVSGSVFQALGNGVYSLLVSVARQLVVLLPVAWLMARTGNIDMVWLSFPIAELMSVAVSAFFLVRIYRQKIKPL